MELNFRKLGSGYPIVILHGLYGMSDNWISIARFLSVSNEVWLPDMRNHGHSPHTSIHTYEAMTNDVIEFIHQHQIVKPVLIGHSMGGKVAMNFARTNHEMIAGLGIVDIAPKNYSVFETHDPHKHIIDSLCKLDLNSIHHRDEADEMLSKDIPSHVLRAFLLKNLQRTPNGFQWLFNLPVLKENLEHIAGGFGEEWNQCIVSGIPVLFFKGALSDYINEQDFPFIEKIFPSSNIEIIPHAGHWLHAQNPDAFLNALKTYLL